MGKKRITALLLAISLVALTACGATESNGSTTTGSTTDGAQTETASGTSEASAIDLSEHVDLTMYLVGDIPENYDAVLAEVNEVLEEELNCSLSVEWLSWAEHDTKYSLLFSGGDDFDMIYTASGWCHYEQTAALGGFMELTDDFIQTYAPDIYAELPEVAWNQATLDGSIYMVPANFVEVNPTALAIRGDLMEQCGYSDIKTWDELVSFWKDSAAEGNYAFASDGSTVYVYDLWRVINGWEGVGGPLEGNVILYNTMDAQDTSVTYLLDMEEFTEFCHLAKELADAGCWPSDILGNTDARENGLLNGKASSMIWNTGTCQIYANEANSSHPEWKVNIYDVNPAGSYAASSYSNSGIGINVNSQNKERAMMAINLMATNKEIMDVTSLGIQGENWEPLEEDTYTPVNAYVPSNWWGWRNMNYMRTLYDENATEVDVKYNELNEYYLENVRAEHPYDGFTFDTTPVATQFAAVEAAAGSYWYPLVFGQVSDVDATIEQFRAALESAGIRDVIAEIEKQTEAYLSAQE